MNLQAIIFDLGGTLIEYTGSYSSWPDLETPGFLAAYEFLGSQGLKLPTFERFRMVGFDILPNRWRLATSGQRNLTLPSLLAEVLENLKVELSDQTVLLDAANRYERSVCADARPIPNSRQIVSHFHSMGLRLGLISNTMFSGTVHREDLSRFHLLSYFDRTFFSADVGMWKPNPEIFLTMLDELETRPSDAVYIGDDPAADIVGGKRAGLYTIHFRSNQRFPSPDGTHPDQTIEELGELPAVVARLIAA